MNETKKSSLYIITSDLDENHGFNQKICNIFKSIEDQKFGLNILVESEKITRRRWIQSGLSREYIEKFIPYNEHNQTDINPSIIERMKNGEIFFLISDEGVPAFFDPGNELIRLMHKNKLIVRCLGLDCSPILALVLSGMESTQFLVAGFPATKLPQRLEFFRNYLSNNLTSIMMDTAYRLKNTLNEVKGVEGELKVKYNYFLGMDLSRPTEEYYLGNIDKLIEYTQNSQKKDFVLVREKNKL